HDLEVDQLIERVVAQDVEHARAGDALEVVDEGGGEGVGLEGGAVNLDTLDPGVGHDRHAVDAGDDVIGRRGVVGRAADHAAVHGRRGDDGGAGGGLAGRGWGRGDQFL